MLRQIGHCICKKRRCEPVEMRFTEAGMLTDVSELHPENADSPIPHAELGMVTDMSNSHP